MHEINYCIKMVEITSLCKNFAYAKGTQFRAFVDNTIPMSYSYLTTVFAYEEKVESAGRTSTERGYFFFRRTK